jgi:hypothetical protein
VSPKSGTRASGDVLGLYVADVGRRAGVVGPKRAYDRLAAGFPRGAAPDLRLRVGSPAASRTYRQRDPCRAGIPRKSVRYLTRGGQTVPFLSSDYATYEELAPIDATLRYLAPRLMVPHGFAGGGCGGCGGGSGFGIRNVHEKPNTIVRPCGRAIA